jgi:hypothetical protein
MKVCITLAVMLALSHPAACPTGMDEKAPFLADSVKKMMASESCAVRAWGAYLTARHEVTEVLPAVISLLDPLPEGAPDEALFVQYAALDALIRMQADVPARKLLAMPSRFQTEAYLLLSNKPESNQEDLIRLIRRPRTSSACWKAVCNLLVPLKTPGLAAYLLDKLSLRLSVSVMEPGIVGGGSGGKFGIGFADCRFSVPAGFPPITHYYLKESYGPKSRLAPAGRQPVWCERLVVQPGSTEGFGFTTHKHDNNDILLGYLAGLVGVSVDDLPFTPEQNHTLLWNESIDFSKEIDLLRDNMRGEFKQFLERLQALNLLTGAEAGALHPEVHVDVHDCRTDKSKPLPAIDSKP